LIELRKNEGWGGFYRGSGVVGAAGGAMGCFSDETNAMIAATSANQKPKVR